MKTESNKIAVKNGRIYSLVVFVGAFLGALLLWLYAVGYDSAIFERSFSGISVDIVGEESLEKTMGYTLRDELEMYVTVTVSGSRNILNKLSAADFSASIDVSGVTEAGDIELPVSVQSPNGVEVKELFSSSAVLFIDRYITRTGIQVEYDLGSYELASDLSIAGVTVTPSEISVEGPASYVNNIKTARVSINHTYIDGDINDAEAIELIDTDGNAVSHRYISMSSKAAQVSVSVNMQKVVSVETEYIGGTLDQSFISNMLSSESVEIIGPVNVVAAIDRVVLRIDESTVNKKAYFTFKTTELLPSGVSVTEGSPQTITATVSIIQLSSKSYSIPAEAIRVINLQAGMNFKVSAGTRITVFGKTEFLRELTADGITATIDYNTATQNEDRSYTGYVTAKLNEETAAAYILNEAKEIIFTVEFQ